MHPILRSKQGASTRQPAYRDLHLLHLRLGDNNTIINLLVEFEIFMVMWSFSDSPGGI